MLGSLKTTAAGAAAGIGIITFALQDGRSTAQIIGGIVAGVAVMALGVFAKDWNVSSVEKKSEPPAGE